MTNCKKCLVSCPGQSYCECPCHLGIESMDKPKPTDFGSLDQIMMMMVFGASNVVDKHWRIEKQAKTIAEFYAQFLGIRSTHETDHTIKQPTTCPFCMSLKLSLALNREVSQ